MDEPEEEAGLNLRLERKLGGRIRQELADDARRGPADVPAPAGATRRLDRMSGQKNGARRRRISRGKTGRSERLPELSMGRRRAEPRRRGAYHERSSARSSGTRLGLDQKPVDAAAGNKVEICERQFGYFLGRDFLQFFGGHDRGDYVGRHGECPFPLCNLVGLAGPDLVRRGTNFERPKSPGKSPVNALFTPEALGHTPAASVRVPRTSVAT